MTARVSMLLKSRGSLTCFRASFLPGRAKDLSAPRYCLATPFTLLFWIPTAGDKSFGFIGEGQRRSGYDLNREWRSAAWLLNTKQTTVGKTIHSFIFVHFCTCFCSKQHSADSRGQLKCDGTRTETRFRLSAKRARPIKSAGDVSSVDYWQPRCAHQR